MGKLLGGSKSKSKPIENTPFEATEEETALLGQLTEWSDRQMDEFFNYLDQQEDIFAGMEGFFENPAFKDSMTQTADYFKNSLKSATRGALMAQMGLDPSSNIDLENADAQRRAELNPIAIEMARESLKSMKSGYAATDEQKALIDEYTNLAIEQGKSDISSFLTESTEDMRDILAPSRGFRASDAPIMDAAGRVQREATRQFAQMSKGLREEGVRAKLQHPLAVASLANQASQFQQQLASGTSQFQDQLAMSAQQNRAQLGMGQLGMRQAALQMQAPGYGAWATMHGARMGRPRWTVLSSSSSSSGIGGILSGAGALISSI